MSEHNFSRRHFFYGALLAGAVPVGGFGSSASLKGAGYKSPNEKLNVASIGAGGKAASDTQGVAQLGQNIVALTDVDDKRAAATYARFPKAKTYRDFRKMLDAQEKEIDAVIVAIPDFMHATCALAAMERGKHVYVQKPMARTVWECRVLKEAAIKYNVATQMGNQGYAEEGSRVASEMIWNGDIGSVTEVHAWTNRPIWPQGLTSAPKEESVPDTMDWDLWLGIQSMRPYSSAYMPFNWRGFYDFGCGALGDMACHVLGAPNMALLLGPPTSVECITIEGKSEFTFPNKSVIRYDFPARGSMAPVKIFWHDGVPPGKAPYRPEGIPADEPLGDAPRPAPAGRGGNAAAAPAAGQQAPADPRTPGRMESVSSPSRDSQSGVLFCGSNGYITCGEYGGGTRLVPAAKMADYKFPPKILNRSPGTYADWVRACKGGDEACSNFNVSSPFTEWVALGVVALRFPNQKLEWDPVKLRVTNVAAANQYLKPDKIRPGYKLSWKL
jgi:predicted dehydrogenase